MLIINELNINNNNLYESVTKTKNNLFLCSTKKIKNKQLKNNNTIYNLEKNINNNRNEKIKIIIKKLEHNALSIKDINILTYKIQNKENKKKIKKIHENYKKYKLICSNLKINPRNNIYKRNKKRLINFKKN